MKRNLLCSGALLAASLLSSSTSAFADSFTLALVPANGQIQGASGSTIGWGYTLTNNSTTNWLQALNLNAGIFQFASLDIGDYFNFPLLSPGSSVTVMFSPAGNSGFGEGLASLTFDPSAPSGFIDSGDFDLSACWATSGGVCVSAAPDAFAPYSATVVVSTPEPSAANLLFSAIVLILLRMLILLGRRFFSSELAT